MIRDRMMMWRRLWVPFYGRSSRCTYDVVRMVELGRHGDPRISEVAQTAAWCPSSSSHHQAEDKGKLLYFYRIAKTLFNVLFVRVS